MSWEVDSKSAKRMADIADALKDDDRLILATDPGPGRRSMACA